VNPFSAIFVPDELREALSDRAWIAALLESERALVNAQALAGAVPAAAAAAIAEACEPGGLDAALLAEHGRAAGNAVVPVVRTLRERVGAEHSGWVHHGATSQDILDSAAMLVTREALRLVGADVERVADACARLANEHRRTAMSARTLLQQAVPTTFGYKAACWLAGVLDARDALGRLRLPAQLGGAAGTLAAFGDGGLDLLRLYAVELDLAEPALPWHTIRTPIAELAGALATTAGVAGKIARDVVLLAQTEVAEVAEAHGGASSTMPHKENPIAAVLACACERHARASCGVLFESLVAEHERAAGAWHAEWHALTAALAATGGAVDAVARSLDGLRVDADRMRANLTDATLSEARRLGRDVSTAAEYLGETEALVDRVLERYRR
jgi:3-carboxy-cis,cis-muconate cycloisomerase